MCKKKKRKPLLHLFYAAKGDRLSSVSPQIYVIYCVYTEFKSLYVSNTPHANRLTPAVTHKNSYAVIPTQPAQKVQLDAFEGKYQPTFTRASLDLVCGVKLLLKPQVQLISC